MMAENNSGQTPSQSELMQWANTYGLTHPVVADGGFNTVFNYIGTTGTNSIGLPNMQLLAPGMSVIEVNAAGYFPDFQQYLPN